MAFSQCLNVDSLFPFLLFFDSMFPSSVYPQMMEMKVKGGRLCHSEK